MIALVSLAFASLTSQPHSCCPSMSEFVKDPAFAAVHERPLALKFKSSEGKTVTFFGNGGSHSGYFVPGRKPVGIVMVHEYWGLNDYIKREAVRLHDATGYSVLAVDLYNGQVAQTPQEAGKMMAAVNADQAAETIKAAEGALLGGQFHKAISRLGTIGWCFGGGWSLQAAIQGGSKVKACVMYYGMPDNSPEDLKRLQAPVLMIEALKDKWINPEVVGKFKKSMGKAHRTLVVRAYDADHAFANPSNPHYDKADSADAMAHTLQFLKKLLG